MTDSIRKQIRDKIEDILIAAQTDAGGNVYQHRTLAMEEAVLPALNVMTTNENSQRLAMGMSSSLLERDLTVRIECYYKSDATSATSLSMDFQNETYQEGGGRAEDRVLVATEALAEQVESAMAADTTLGGFAKDSYLTSTNVELNSDNSVSNEVGVITLEYMVHYQTRRNTPTTAN